MSFSSSWRCEWSVCNYVSKSSIAQFPGLDLRTVCFEDKQSLSFSSTLFTLSSVKKEINWMAKKIKETLATIKENKVSLFLFYQGLENSTVHNYNQPIVCSASDEVSYKDNLYEQRSQRRIVPQTWGRKRWVLDGIRPHLVDEVSGAPTCDRAVLLPFFFARCCSSPRRKGTADRRLQVLQLQSYR